VLGALTAGRRTLRQGTAPSQIGGIGRPLLPFGIALGEQRGAFLQQLPVVLLIRREWVPDRLGVSDVQACDTLTI
jgi:hypothetical protein